MIVYLVVISLIAVILTAYDKGASKRKKGKKKKRRVPEKLLWTVAILGGALAEYITMKLIRHKTRHKSFMRGLPAVILLQAGLCIAYYFLF